MGNEGYKSSRTEFVDSPVQSVVPKFPFSATPLHFLALLYILMRASGFLFRLPNDEIEFETQIFSTAMV